VGDPLQIYADRFSGHYEVATVVTPETLLVWHRKLIAQRYDGTAHRSAGRPCTADEIEALVVRMAEENPA
jgi:hypothetical protein